MKVFRPLFLVCLVTLSLSAFAKQAEKAAPPKGFRAEFLANLDDVQSKIIALAEATPAEKFEWRPESDVRSISEVYMHIVGGNYFLPTFAGYKAPSNLDRDMEKNVTTKAAVVAELKKSFDHLRAAAASVNEADLEKPVKMFGNQTTYRGVFLTAISHLHEHLGQSIAYARMNKIAPPWSAAP